MKICFTGYRPQKLPWGYCEADARCAALKARLREVVFGFAGEDPQAKFMTGGALGVDTYAAEAVLAARRECPGITLEIAVPCAGQAEKWREADKNRYLTILAAADCVTELAARYSSGCMARRNRYMVDASDVVVAVGGERPGGTAETLRYAERAGKRVVRIPLGEDA